MKRNSGLQKRWLRNTLSILFAIVLLCVIALSIMVAAYYYSSMEAGMEAKARTSTSFFDNYVRQSYNEYYQSCAKFAQSFDSKDQMELQFVNTNNRIVASSYGVYSGMAGVTSDIREAIETKAIASYTGTNPATGERIMAVSSPLIYTNGEVIGVLRYVTSLRRADRQIMLFSLCAALVGLIVLLVVYVSGRYFVKSILVPVQELTATAKRISTGSYGVQIPRKSDDEIGELTDTINEMSEKISRAEKMQSEFVSSVSHELRTPLTAISGWSETLLSAGAGVDSAEARRGLSIIQREAARLTDMVEELLEFTRLQDGRFTLNVVPCDLRTEFEDTVFMYGSRLRQEGIVLDYLENDDDIPEIPCDPARMKQVFLNIQDHGRDLPGKRRRAGLRRHPHPRLRPRHPRRGAAACEKEILQGRLQGARQRHRPCGLRRDRYDAQRRARHRQCRGRRRGRHHPAPHCRAIERKHMAKKNTQQPQEQFKTMIGGQALIEGIMMLGPEKSAVVVRTKDGLQRKVEPRKLSQKWSPKKLPFIRGIFNFCTSMKTGVSALMYSADFFAEEDEDEKGKEPGRFEAWLEKRLSSEKAQNALITFSVVLGLAFSIALFFVLPSLLGSFLNRFVTTNEIVRNLLEGLLRIVIFLAYMFLVSRMKDMRRVFSYHGAEHKTIRCYEAKLPLTVENARKMTRLHPRCGTSFLFVVMIVSILVFSLATPLLRPITAGITSHWLEAIVRVVLKLLLLPIVVGISYEFNRLVGRHDNWLTRALSAPGMWLQYLTTNEPDDSMLEVGIEALTLVLPEKEGEDRW